MKAIIMLAPSEVDIEAGTKKLIDVAADAPLAQTDFTAVEVKFFDVSDRSYLHGQLDAIIDAANANFCSRGMKEEWL